MIALQDASNNLRNSSQWNRRVIIIFSLNGGILV